MPVTHEEGDRYPLGPPRFTTLAHLDRALCYERRGGEFESLRWYHYGACRQAVKTSDCDSDMRGFESHHAPQYIGILI